MMIMLNNELIFYGGDNINDVDVTNAIVSCLAMADRKRALDLYFLEVFVADDIKGLFGIQGGFFNWSARFSVPK